MRTMRYYVKRRDAETAADRGRPLCIARLDGALRCERWSHRDGRYVPDISILPEVVGLDGAGGWAPISQAEAERIERAFRSARPGRCRSRPGIFIRAPLVERGGEGSGHWGHEGRPGHRGGSLPGKGGPRAMPSPTLQERPRSRWSERAYFVRGRGGTSAESERYGTLREALEADARAQAAQGVAQPSPSAWAVDPARGLGIGFTISSEERPYPASFPPGVPIDWDIEADRVLEVYDHMARLLTDPGARPFVEAMDRHGEAMLARAQEYAQEVAQAGLEGRDPRMTMAVVFTNHPHQAGAGSAGDWGAKVFWVPTQIPPEASATEQATFVWGTSPIYTAVHELHHAWGSRSELDVFSDAVAMDFAIDHRDLLGPNTTSDMVATLARYATSAARPARGEDAGYVLRNRAALGFLYERHPDFFEDLHARSVGQGLYESDRVAYEWSWARGQRVTPERLRKWADQTRSGEIARRLSNLGGD